jgi:hypothetical protein
MLDPRQGIDRVLIFQKIIPYQQGICEVFKIVIPGHVGYWFNIS